MALQDPAPAELHRLRWHQMFFLAMGVPGTVFTLFGYSLGAVGTVVAIALWTLAAVVALVQNHLWLKLAETFGWQNGGLAMFAAEGWKRRMPLVAPIASMGYWLAWVVTPATMARLAASFILEKWYPGLSFSLSLGPIELEPANSLAILIVVLLGIVNLRGVAAISRFAYISGISLLIPIGLSLLGPLLVPDWSLSTRLARPLAPLDHLAQAQLLLAWMFVVCASVYASEMTTVFAAEYRSPRDARLAGWSISLFSIAVFSLVPLGLAGMIDPASFALDPAAAFVQLFDRLTSIPYGTDIIVAILVGNMAIATSGAIADAARGFWANARQGLIPRQFEVLNRHGVPHRALLAGLAIQILLLAANTPVVGIIATGTIGFMMAVLLGLSAFLIVAPYGDGPAQRAWSWVVRGLLAFNGAIFAVGVYSFRLTGYGGWQEAVLGFAILFSSVILFQVRQRQRAGAQRMVA